MNSMIAGHEDIDGMTLDELCQNLADPLNLDEGNQNNTSYFSLAQRNDCLLYQFENKQVNEIYNILLNFVSSQIDSNNNSFSTQNGSATITSSLGSVQILAPNAFLNCTYKECELQYNGSVNFKSRDNRVMNSKYQIKLCGVFFPQNLSNLCQAIKIQMRQQRKENEEVDIFMRNDGQAEIFSYRKAIKHVRIDGKESSNFKVVIG